jgi:hypothetical protein
MRLAGLSNLAKRTHRVAQLDEPEDSGRKESGMGQKLFAFFDAITKEGGVQCQVRLAMKTCMSGEKAKTEPDSPENIQKFKDAYKAITGKDAPVS